MLSLKRRELRAKTRNKVKEAKSKTSHAKNQVNRARDKRAKQGVKLAQLAKKPCFA